MASRQVHPNSLENLKLGASARYQGKQRCNLTLKPETIAWLKQRGNASEYIDLFVASACAGLLKHDRNTGLIVGTNAELERYKKKLELTNREISVALYILKDVLQQKNGIDVSIKRQIRNAKNILEKIID